MASKWIRSGYTSGAQDGSSYADAYNGDTVGNWQGAWNAMSAGDTLYVVQGTYPSTGTFSSTLFTNANGGSAGSYKYIKGVITGGSTTEATGTDRPLLTGSWAIATFSSGPKFFDAGNGSDYISISAIRTTNFLWHYDFFEYQNDHIILSNLDMREGQNAIWFRGLSTVTGATPDVGASNDINISDIYIKNFTKRGMRFSHGCYDVAVTDVEVDMGGVTYDKENFMVAIEVGNGSGIDTADHDFTFTRVVARNSYDNNGASYWNADGFSVEDNTYNMVFVYCEAYDNTDGGWDIKWNNTHGNPPVFTDCIAIGNGRNYRLWGTSGAATMTRCLAAFPHYFGGSSSPCNIWTQGTISLTSCTLHSPITGYNILMDDSATPVVTMTNCIVSMLSTDVGGTQIFILAGTINGSGSISGLTSNGTVVYNQGSVDPLWAVGTDPGYVNPTNSAFEGEDDSFDPATYVSGESYTKGYYNIIQSPESASSLILNGLLIHGVYVTK